MKISLKQKFILGYVLLGILLFTGISIIGTPLTYRWIRNRKVSTLYKEASQLSTTYGPAFLSGELSDVQISILKNEARLLDAEIWLMTKDGEIMLQTNSSSSITAVPDFDATDSGQAVYFEGDFYQIFSENTLTVYAPITGYLTTRGYVLIHFPTASLQETADELLTWIYLTCGITFFSFLIFLLLLDLYVTRPLKKITSVAKEYTAGNLKYHNPVRSTDELGYLSATLYYMANELYTNGEDQRKFIANISHDFRSPLTSIRGYIEAILDGTIPSSSQEKYLRIVANETDRLATLTQSLLTLNTYGPKGVILDIVHFDINHMIKKILATFEGRCSARAIHFELTFSQENFYVYGDEGKIQQVLYNLIDNAIKFSSDDSTIYISTYPRYEKAFVSIKDRGCGIPRESLGKVFDRFYKADISRGRDKKGTGLGLSIVREILQAHNENIDVISTEGVGSEFIFSLPLKKKSDPS